MIDRRTPLQCTTLELEDGHGNERKYQIDAHYASGGSCLVYRGHYRDIRNNQHSVFIKEFYPNIQGITRDDCSKLNVPQSIKEPFEALKEQFQASYDLQVKFRETTSSTNATSEAWELIPYNDTIYVIMSADVGSCYKDFKDNSLLETVQTARELAEIISRYHKNGYLHLDLKPANIFLLDEKADRLKLFDFGSVVNITDITTRKAPISYSEGYSAPEQHFSICTSPNFDDIGVWTDFYAIGAMVFERIMGRHPCISDCNMNYLIGVRARLEQSGTAVNPILFPKLEDFFSKTLHRKVEKRYQTDADMLEALNNLVDVASTPIYLISKTPKPVAHFEGKEDDLKNIHELFQHSDTVVLRGMGGIGKTELAKKYAEVYGMEYDTILFAQYRSNLKDLITSDRDICIHGISGTDSATKKDYYDVKLKQMEILCDKRVLLVIDRMDTVDDPNLFDLKELSCKILITSRNDFSVLNVKQYLVERLSEEQCFHLFCTHYEKPLNADYSLLIKHFIKCIDGLTLVVVLLAKGLKDSPNFEENLYALLSEETFYYPKEKVRQEKDGQLQHDSVESIIESVFNVFTLSKGETDVLRHMALVHYTGITRNQLNDWMALDNFDDVNELVHKWWITRSPEDVISLHQIISDVAYKMLKPDLGSCLPFVNRMLESETFYANPLKEKTPQEHFSKAIALQFMNRRLFPGGQVSPKYAEVAIENIEVQSELFRLGNGFEGEIESLQAMEKIAEQNPELEYYMGDLYLEIAEIYNGCPVESMQHCTYNMDRALEYTFKALTYYEGLLSVEQRNALHEFLNEFCSRSQSDKGKPKFKQIDSADTLRLVFNCLPEVYTKIAELMKRQGGHKEAVSTWEMKSCALHAISTIS